MTLSIISECECNRIQQTLEATAFIIHCDEWSNTCKGILPRLYHEKSSIINSAGKQAVFTLTDSTSSEPTNWSLPAKCTSFQPSNHTAKRAMLVVDNDLWHKECNVHHHHDRWYKFVSRVHTKSICSRVHTKSEDMFWFFKSWETRPETWSRSSSIFKLIRLASGSAGKSRL